MSSRGHVWLLFGCFWVVDSSFFGVSVFSFIDRLTLLNTYEGMHCSLLMSFVRAFFNRLDAFCDADELTSLLRVAQGRKTDARHETIS